MISLLTVIIAVVISFLVALFWLGVINHTTGFLKWKNNNIFNLAFGGIAAVGIAGILEFILLEDKYLFGMDSLVTNYSSKSYLLFYIVIAALLEEFFKGIVIWWGIRKVLAEKTKDGVLVGLVVGLFFAVAENAIYFATQINSSGIGSLVNLIIIRTIFSSVAHMIFSGIMGGFIVKIFFCKRILLKTFFFIGALVFSVMVHSFFNYFVSVGNSWVLMSLMAVGILGVFFVLRNYKKSL